MGKPKEDISQMRTVFVATLLSISVSTSGAQEELKIPEFTYCEDRWRGAQHADVNMNFCNKDHEHPNKRFLQHIWSKIPEDTRRSCIDYVSSIGKSRQMAGNLTNSYWGLVECVVYRTGGAYLLEYPTFRYCDTDEGRRRFGADCQERERYAYFGVRLPWNSGAFSSDMKLRCNASAESYTDLLDCINRGKEFWENPRANDSGRVAPGR